MEKFIINAVARLRFHDDVFVSFMVFVCLFMGCFLIFYLISYCIMWRGVRGWVAIPGFVERLDSKNQKIVFEYGYVFEGEKYIGKRVSIGFHRKQDLQGSLLKTMEIAFGVNKPVCVYVNSKRPSDSCLEVKFDAWGVLLLFFIGILALSTPLIINFIPSNH